MKTCTILLGVLLAAACAAPAADDGNWPRFRGPNGSGVSDATTIPAQWTETNYNWKVTLPGVGHSSPVVWGKRLFVTCGENATARRTVVCLEAASGRTLWKQDYPSKTFQQNNDNSYATASPAADADGVVVSWATPEEVVLLALDNDGKEQWRRSLGPFVAAHGSGSSPIITGDVVVLSDDQDDLSAKPEAKSKAVGKSFVVAVDRKTGKTRWQLERNSNQASYATPCVRALDDGRSELIVNSTAHGITGVDLATGKIDWELGGLFVKRCVGSPVWGEGLVVADEGSGGVGAHLVAVKPGPPPALAYELQKPLPYVPTPLIKDGKLFLWGDNGAVACLRAATGELVWRDKVDATFYSSPVWVNHRLYGVSKAGDVFVLGTGDTFELLARVPLGEKSFATPAIAGGVMYLRTYSQLFSLGTGRLSTAVRGSAVTDQCMLGTVFALKMK